MRTLPRFTGFDDCATPPDVYEKLNAEFHFDSDPCPLRADFDGLAPAYEWGERPYVNPPYSNPYPWVMRALREWKMGKTVVMLLKSDTSTLVFHDLILPCAAEIRFLRGRLKFPPYGKPAPFASMVVIFRGTNHW